MTSVRTGPDDDARLDAAFAVFRHDCRRAPADDLAARVMARIAAGDPEAARFHRTARGYAAAAAVLLAFGVGGSIHVRSSSAGPRVAPNVDDLVDDLVEARLAREQSAALSDQPVTGKADQPMTGTGR